MQSRDQYKDNNRLLQQMLNWKKALIAVHRGTRGGNIIENTIAAFDISISMGADLFECDVSMSTDGVLYAFHDGEEERLLGVKSNICTMDSQRIDAIEYRNSIGLPSGRNVQRLEQVLQRYYGCAQLFNIDRSWNYLPQVVQLLHRYPQLTKQLIIKTPVKEEYLDFFSNTPEPYMYMPIVQSSEDITKVLARPKINTVGIEIIARHREDELLSASYIQSLREHVLYIWVNTLVLSNLPDHRLSGGLNDDDAVQGRPDDTWGLLFSHGVNILHTDWPAQLKQYRDTFFAGKANHTKV
jgi:glycerophosphoryl diester phosphodiesterase